MTTFWPKLQSCALLAACVCADLDAAHAGVVAVAGRVLPGTCAVKSGGDTFEVSLPRVDADRLRAAGDEAAHTAWFVDLECAAAGGQVALGFESPTHHDPATGDLAPQGPNAAANLRLALYDAAGNRKRFDGSVHPGQYLPVIAGPIRLQYLLVYRALGRVSPGRADANATFVIVHI
ncbi:fimbrial protein [Pseudoxanthomonas sp.]|jgi:type 1 fimbria pilin|uniref:fimbrial protein n=1 Tax=Pseudoxanthomonas sp. TaxID=1871049 RepID=UPI002E1116FB|nr:fimbrial protein [Pseudoxanthomonas sp.]